MTLTNICQGQFQWLCTAIIFASIAMKKSFHLTKSRYVDGLRCPKKLWYGTHEPLPKTDPKPFSALDVGIRVGKGAHQLFPDGVEIMEEPWEHAQAVAKTNVLITNSEIPAIFEAAFEYENIRIRVDVLERLVNGQWGIREVKSSTSVKEEKFHIDDVAVQLYVVRGSGLDVTSVELIHVNSEFTKGEDAIDWRSLLTRADVTQSAEDRLDGIKNRVQELFTNLHSTSAPDIYPTKSRCHNPYRCDYWDRCISDKPNDWVACLPRVSSKKLMQLKFQEIETIRDIPADFKLSDRQLFVRDVVVSEIPHISSNLTKSLD